jgi:hypothetical protein
VASGALTVHAIRRLKDPNEGKDGEGEGGPVNEAAEILSFWVGEQRSSYVRRGALVIKDSPQRPGDDESTRKVAINGGKRVRGGSSLQEEADREMRDISDRKD